MQRHSLWILAIIAFLICGQLPAAENAMQISPDEKQQLEKDWNSLGEAIAKLRTRDKAVSASLLADASLHHRSVEWALRYEPAIRKTDAELIRRALARGTERVRQLAAGQPDWQQKKGRLSRAYVSAVDGSVQPYGLLIPEGYDPSKPHRLDVVLHGSMGPAGANEVRFLKSFDEPSKTAKPPQFFELHPLGRMENCYRWAGEADVFEAIQDVCAKYNIDRDRIVLRGMSMGASGTWHLGLKHPDKFVALGPYCGYVDTHRFSQTPIARFPLVGPLPQHQELALHMLDSKDYAGNAHNVPAIACMGDKDIFIEAHEIMGRAMQKEGVRMVNLISHGTGHVIDPVTHAEQMRRIGEYAQKGLDHTPQQIRFVTWTLKYSRCHWIQVLGLEQHYAKAQIAAKRTSDNEIEVTDARNVTRFAILRPVWNGKAMKVRIAGKLISTEDSPLGAGQNERHPGPGAIGGVFVRENSRWQFLGHIGPELPGKRPGQQGPIDDAFSSPFLCVRGTGAAWNSAVQNYSDAALDRFAAEWHQYFRGKLPVKNDSDITDEDIKTKNLILFGDPGSNPWISKVLPKMPVEWTRDTIRFRGETYPAANHVPALIQPSPLPGAASHYVVINSGHTFRGKDLETINYLLFPRWGDWAMLRISTELKPNQEPAWESVLDAGYFDELWRAPAAE